MKPAKKAPVTPLANGQWEARVHDLPVSPSPMPEAGLSDPSVRRAGPGRRTALSHLRTSIPTGQPRLQRAGRAVTSTLSETLPQYAFVCLSTSAAHHCIISTRSTQ